MPVSEQPFTVRFDASTETRIWEVVRACGAEASRADIVRAAVGWFLRGVRTYPEWLREYGYDNSKDQDSIH